MKTALITGITGQDGSFLAELLLDKGMMFTARSAVRRPTTASVLLIWRENLISICTTLTLATR